MLRATVLEVLNAQARALGSRPIIDRTLEDWIEEDLVEGPIERGQGRGPGPDWRYKVNALKQAMEVVRLKASGPRRNAAIRLQLWLGGFDVPHFRVTADLRSEFDRLLRRKFFRDPIQYDARRRGATDRFLKSDLRRLGPLDPTLGAAGIGVSRETLLLGASDLVHGSRRLSEFSVTNPVELASRFVSQAGSELFASLAAELKPIVQVAGLFGNPDEIEGSGLAALSEVSGDDLALSRRLYRCAIAMFEAMSQSIPFVPVATGPNIGDAIAKIVRTLRESDEWCVSGLVAGAVAAQRVRTARH